MLTVENLKAIGVNTEEGINRCAGMKDFYLKMVEQSINEAKFPALRTAIESRDFNTAFEIAHSMKGVYANLSLDPVLKPVQEITDLLRKKTETDYSELLNRAETEFSKLKNLVN